MACQKRLVKGSITTTLTDVIFRLLAYMYLLFGALVFRLSKVQNNEIATENHQGNSRDKQLVQPNTVELLHPCCQKLQHLENAVTELLKKPAGIPPEKDDILLESLDRIKSIEHDLQKTKKVSRVVNGSVFKMIYLLIPLNLILEMIITYRVKLLCVGPACDSIQTTRAF